MEPLPLPARARLLHLTRILEDETGPISSARLEAITGWTSHTIRRDISGLGPQAGATPAGYEPAALRKAIRAALGLDRAIPFCVVGLGRLGSAFLNLGGAGDQTAFGEFVLAAGFDTNVNRTEILPSPAPLYPAYKMREVIPRLGIEIALLCVPGSNAQAAAGRLVDAGIRGIVNFTPAALTVAVPTRNVHVRDEMRELAITMNL